MLTGYVDDQRRALVRVPISASRDGSRAELLAWVDTAFNGGLTIPRARIATLGLKKASSAAAVLADGSGVDLDTFVGFFDWFGNCYRTQVIASDAAYPLLGTMLLDGHRLTVNYAAKTVELV